MAGRYNVTIEQGATWQLTVTWSDSSGSPVNLTGYTAKAQVKTSAAGTTLITADSTAGTITLGGAAGTIAIAVPAATTAAVSAQTGVWDLLLTSGGGTKTRLLEGTVQITAGVTT